MVLKYWDAISDHRPLLCWLTGPAFIQLVLDGQNPRHPACSVRRHGLKKEDKKTVDDYFCELRKLNAADDLQGTGGPVQTAMTLLRLSKNGVIAMPKKECSVLHQKFFVDCWSPTMVALDAHLLTVTEIANHL